MGEGGSTGLITYMRTDSTQIAAQAQKEARNTSKNVMERFPTSTRTQYKTRASGAQEAHEAIRPTSVFREPTGQGSAFARPVPAIPVDLAAVCGISDGKRGLRYVIDGSMAGKGSTHNLPSVLPVHLVRFPGYLVVYEEAADEDAQKDEGEDNRIPADLKRRREAAIGRNLTPNSILRNRRRATPKRLLVQKMEENGIGRPSTYAPILSTIQERGYVIREQKRLIPTDTGILVNDLIDAAFSGIDRHRFYRTNGKRSG